MSLAIFSQLKLRISHLTFNSVLYNWSLRGEVPDRLMMKPVDVWPGDTEIGAQLCEGGFQTHMGERYIHGFTWLRHLPAYAYKTGQQTAVCEHVRGMILDWVHRYRNWEAQPWRVDVTGERLAMWISLYEFFSHDCVDGACDEEFHDVFFDSLARQARHLARNLNDSDVQGVGVFQAAKGLLYAGFALEGHEHWAEQALDSLVCEIKQQILGDGAHVSRSPAQLLEVLQILLDVRGALSTAGYPLPDEIQHGIDRAGQALRFFRYNDKHFGLFNGAQKGDIDFIDRVLAQAGAKGKVLESLPCAGYERVQLGRSLLMFDCGTPPETPYDYEAHSAPLSFEMSYGRERLFVNCGSHPYDAAWKDALKGTVAHNSVCLDNRNACEITESGMMSRKPRKVTAMREETKDACLLEGAHDGYECLNGFTHRRRLYVSDQGNELRGEDVLKASSNPARGVEAAVRFHIHPRVNVSLIQSGAEALLRLPSGVGWRFKHHGGVLTLEDSVYLGSGIKPVKTKQLVIYGHIFEKYAQIKWGLSKEG